MGKTLQNYDLASFPLYQKVREAAEVILVVDLLYLLRLLQRPRLKHSLESEDQCCKYTVKSVSVSNLTVKRRVCFGYLVKEKLRIISFKTYGLIRVFQIFFWSIVSKRFHFPRS